MIMTCFGVLEIKHISACKVPDLRLNLAAVWRSPSGTLTIDICSYDFTVYAFVNCDPLYSILLYFVQVDSFWEACLF